MSFDWASILGNVASGGVLGLLGTGVSFACSYFKNKQEHGFRLSEMELQAKVDAAKLAGEVAVQREKGAGEAFTASQQAEASLGGGASWTDQLRKATRPVLTLLLVLLTTALWFSTNDAELKAYIAQNIVTATVAAVTWWFGQRSIDRGSLRWGNSTAGASVSSK
jgi:hypothetical protein